MEPGHPFATATLDDRRSRQRAALRCFPDWLLTEDRYLPRALLRADKVREPALAETLVRDLADEYLEQLKDFLARWGAEMRTSRLADFVQNETSDAPGKDLEAARERLAETVSRRVTAVKNRVLEAEELHLVPAAILLLAWADALAGDYTDPRLPKATRQSAALDPNAFRV